MRRLEGQDHLLQNDEQLEEHSAGMLSVNEALSNVYPVQNTNALAENCARLPYTALEMLTNNGLFVIHLLQLPMLFITSTTDLLCRLGPRVNRGPGAQRDRPDSGDEEDLPHKVQIRTVFLCNDVSVSRDRISNETS